LRNNGQLAPRIAHRETSFLPITEGRQNGPNTAGKQERLKTLPVAITLAEAVIAAQEAEIRWMEDWLAGNGG
jgi:hypothetical protein